MLETLGVDQVVAVDLHREQIEGFFSAQYPCENINLAEAAIPYFLSLDLVDPVVVGNCGAGVHRALHFKELLTDAMDKVLCFVISLCLFCRCLLSLLNSLLFLLYSN